MPLTASKLRADIYRILDQVLETGAPVDIERKGRMLRIVAVAAPSKLERLRPHDYLAVDPEDLVSTSWADTWDPDRAVDPDAMPRPSSAPSDGDSPRG